MDWILGHEISEPPISLPPEIPNINGPIIGRTKTNYNYTIVTSDPELEEISYYINWGDGTVKEMIGPYDSNEKITSSHQWLQQGNYIIQVKAKDCNDEESNWGTLEVNMPKNKPYINTPLLQFLKYNSHLFPLLRQLLNLQ